MSVIDVVGLGAMNMDHLYQVERLVRDGETNILGHASLPGGSAANTVYGLARLGVRTAFLGAVGDDAQGRALVQDLASAGVDTSGIVVKKGTGTGSVLGLTSTRGERALYVSPGANSLLHWEDLGLARLGRARGLLLSSFVGDEQLELQKRLMAGLPPDVAIHFAPGQLYVRRGWRPLAPFLRRTSVLFLNRQELRALTRRDLQEGASRCLATGCQAVVVTLGADPDALCYVAGREEACFVPHPASARDVVDTTGAGDAFAAGFIFGRLAGKSLPECGRLGGLMAGFSLSKLGARAGLPTLPQLEQRYREVYGEPF